MTNSIAQAVAPLKAFSIEAAKDKMKMKCLNYYIRLEEGGWDVNAVFPYERHAYGFSPANARHAFALEITEALPGNLCRRNTPYFVKQSDERMNRAIDEAAEDAAYAYEAYVHKLNLKIGACKSAELSIDGGVWFESMLKITRFDGTTEHWLTKVITNYSKHGKVFNQFPTRKVKRK